MKSILKFIALPLFLIVMAAGYAVLWFTGADTLRDTVRVWVDERREAGWVIEHAGLDIGGFPMSIRARLPDAVITASPAAGGWTARMAALDVTAMAWSPFAPVIAPQGPVDVDLGQDGGRWRVSGARLQATVETGRSDRLEGLELHLRDLRAVPASALGQDGSVPDGAPAVTLQQLTATVTTADAGGSVFEEAAPAKGSYTVMVDGQGLTLPPDLHAPLGQTWQDLELTAYLIGDLPPGMGTREGLMSWRDAGGVVEVERLYVHWAPLEIAIAGTIALDDRLQPVGALSTHVRGFFASVEQLEDRGVIRARDATLARVVLGTMASSAPRGPNGGPVLTLPLTIQGRQLSMGPVALMELPLIKWGSAPQPTYFKTGPGYRVDRLGNVRPVE